MFEVKVRCDRNIRLTAAGLLSTVRRTAMTASATPSFIMFPSHATSTSRVLELYPTTTQPMTRNDNDWSIGISSSTGSSFLIAAPSSLTPFFAVSLVSSFFPISSMAPNVPSRAQRIRSILALLSVIRCRHMMVVVVKPAYSRRSSGAIMLSLNPFCTRTPLTNLASSVPAGGAVSARLPTIFATLSTTKGMRTSSQLAGV